MKKRILSIILAAAMMLTLLPVTALADGTDVPGGECGNGLTWRIEDGVLTISGTGDMWDYNIDTGLCTAPWSGEYFTRLVVENGVTSIGRGAFLRCYHLVYADLGGVTSIGDWAFLNCGNLVSADLSGAVSLGDGAFYGCRGLIGVTLSDDITSIPAELFCDCKALTEITLPAGVTEIGQRAFAGCGGLAIIRFAGNSVKWECVTKGIDWNDAGPAGQRVVCLGDPLVTVTAAASPDEYGTVSGTGQYNLGQTVTLTAAPNDSFGFAYWEENGAIVSFDATYSFSAEADRSLTARFYELRMEYLITAEASPAEGGTVSGMGVYMRSDISNQTVTLTATPASGYRFVNWTEGGEQVSTDARYEFRATANRRLVAVFEPNGTGDDPGGDDPGVGQIVRVILYRNDGTNTMPQYTVLSSASGSVKLPETPPFTNGDYDLLGWATAANSDSIAYRAKDEIKANLNLYAVWGKVSGEFSYILDADNNAVIVDYSGGADPVVIPARLGAISVVRIAAGSGIKHADLSVIVAEYAENSNYPDIVEVKNWFAGNTELTGVWLPSSVVRISSKAFRGCSSLSAVYYAGTSANWANVNKLSGWNIGCPAGMQVICLGDPQTTTYTVTAYASPAEGGTVTGAGTYAAGGPVTLTVTPEEGYVLESLIVDGADVTADVANNAFTFDMPDHSVAVTAVFAEETTWDAIQEVFTNGGTITLRNNVTAPAGAPALTVARSKSVTLDLNGKTLDRGLSGGSMQANGYVIFVSGSATLRITDGTVTGGANSGSGGGIYVDARGVLELSGVAVRGNRSTDHGAGIYLYGSAQCTAENSSVSDNQTTVNTNGGGGGIYLTSGSLNMTNCRINGNKAKNLGGGLYIESGHAELSGCQINGNDAYANACGGGVFLSGGGLRLDGCEVIGNTSSKSSPHGIGVFVNVGARFMVSGETTITDNKSGEQQLNVFLHNGAVIHPVNLADTASIGVAVGKTNASYIAEYRAGVITSGLTDNGSAANFTSDLDAYEVILDTNGEAALALPADPVRVLVTDADSGEALEGVIVQLLWNCEEIETWTSGGEYQLIEGLKAGVEYTLHVAAAPEDHLAGEDSFFSVSADGRVNYSGNTTTNPIMETILLVELKAVSGHALSGECVLFYPEGGYDPITEAHEGQTVVVSPDYDSIDAGWYFTGVYESDEVTVEVDEVGDGSFTMPAQAVTVNAVLAEQEACTVALPDDTPAALPAGMAGILSGAEQYDFDTHTLDLDGDETADLLLDMENNTVTRLDGAAVFSGSVTINLVTVPPYRYSSVTFDFSAAVPITVTAQPQSWQGEPGDYPIIRVEAEGDGLTYQWYWRNAGKTAWNVSSDTDDCYDSYPLNATRNGREVYCRVTDSEGNHIDTQIATMSYALPAGYSGPTITSQPESWVGVMGEQPEIRLEAEGEGELTYKWYYRDVGKTKFSLSSEIDACYNAYALSLARAGRVLYCVVSDRYGFTAKSVTVTMDFDVPAGHTGPEVVSQPESWTGAMGEYPDITFAVEGEGLIYQWYWRNAGKTTWNKSSDTDDCYDSYPLTKVRDGREVYCVATDIYGVSIRSEIATMSRAD